MAKQLSSGMAVVDEASGTDDVSVTDEASSADDVALWMAWEGARRAWLDSKRRKSGSRNTVDAYEIAFRQFFEWCEVPAWQVSPRLAQAWASHLTRDGLAETSVCLKLSALASFYDFVQRRYGLRTPDGREASLWPADRRNPFDAVERPKPSPYGRARFPSVEEVQAMLAVINTQSLTGKRDFALLFSILVTCRRSSEVLRMRWGDIQRSTPQAGAAGQAKGDYVFRYRYKGGQVRRAVLNRLCYEAICAYLRADGRPPEEMGEGDYVFVPLDPERMKRLPVHRDREIDPNRPISNGMANRILKKYARRAGVELEKAHIHGLRHAGARLRVQQMKESGRGVDYGELMDLLGHSSLAVTHIYATRVLEDPEDPGGEAAARALMPGSASRRLGG
jgi:integrase